MWISGSAKSFPALTRDCLIYITGVCACVRVCGVCVYRGPKYAFVELRMRSCRKCFVYESPLEDGMVGVIDVFR